VASAAGSLQFSIRAFTAISARQNHNQMAKKEEACGCGGTIGLNTSVTWRCNGIYREGGILADTGIGGCWSVVIIIAFKPSKPSSLVIVCGCCGSCWCLAGICLLDNGYTSS
jgi:hypothetical protein